MAKRFTKICLSFIRFYSFVCSYIGFLRLKKLILLKIFSVHYSSFYLLASLLSDLHTTTLHNLFFSKKGLNPLNVQSFLLIISMGCGFILIGDMLDIIALHSLKIMKLLAKSPFAQEEKQSKPLRKFQKNINP